MEPLTFITEFTTANKIPRFRNKQVFTIKS